MFKYPRFTCRPPTLPHHHTGRCSVIQVTQTLQPFGGSTQLPGGHCFRLYRCTSCSFGHSKTRADVNTAWIATRMPFVGPDAEHVCPKSMYHPCLAGSERWRQKRCPAGVTGDGRCASARSRARPCASPARRPAAASWRARCLLSSARSLSGSELCPLCLRPANTALAPLA